MGKTKVSVIEPPAHFIAELSTDQSLTPTARRCCSGSRAVTRMQQLQKRTLVFAAAVPLQQ